MSDRISERSMANSGNDGIPGPILIMRLVLLCMIVLSSVSFISVMGNNIYQQSFYWDAFSFGSNSVLIDGIIDDPEWNDSTVTLLQNLRSGRIYTKEDAMHILIAIDCPDPSIVSIALDVDNSGGQSPQVGDIMLQLGMNSTEHTGTGTTWTPVEKGDDWTASQGMSNQYELMMDYNRLGLSPGMPGMIGIFIDIIGPSGHYTYPSDGNLYVPNTWAVANSSDDWGPRKPLYIPPILEYGQVTPMKGFTDTEFTFSIDYTDDFSGDEPSMKEVVIDGTVNVMTTTDDDVTDGAIYDYKTVLKAGQHQFYFIFSDGTTNLRYPGSGSISGPIVVEPNQPPQLVFGGIPSDLLTVNEDTQPVPDLIDLEDYFIDDRDDGSLTFSVVSQQDEVHVQMNGSKLDVVGVVPDWYGSVELIVRALDNGVEGYPVDEYRLETMSNPFKITVLSVNDPPQTPIIKFGLVNVETKIEFTQGQNAELRASSLDLDMVLDPDEEIRFSWWSDIDGALSEGETLNIKGLSVGVHTIKVSVVDTEGGSSSSSIKVIVNDVHGPWYESINGSWQAAIISAVAVLTILTFIGFFTYTRLKSKSLLDNVNRKHIYDAIREEPGMYFSQLSRRLSLKQGVLSHHLNMLEKNSYIRSLQDGKCRRFYLYDQKINYILTLTEVQQAILYLITQNPGVTQTQISSTMGRNKMVVNYHIRILKDIGLLFLDREGRETHCYLTGKSQDLFMKTSVQ